MKELDFSHFKKIQQDKKSAVLKHPDGHEIKIAISGLSPILKKKLIALPLHASDQKKPIEALDENSPASAEPQEAPSAPNVDLAGVKEDVAPSLSSEALDQAVLSPTPAPTSIPAQPAMPPSPPEAPAQPSAAPAAPDQAQAHVSTAPPTPEQEAQQMTAHNLAFADDLKYGRIQPKTYKDLFEEKSTLGKVGAFFGMLLSGVGSGLSGQPNALLGMMDRQIERDLEAQKQNQSNKQSWYKAALEHERNQPENLLKNAEAQKMGTEADTARYNAINSGITDMSATNNALNYGRTMAVQMQQDAVNKMPPGPDKDRAQATLNNMVIPYFVNKVSQGNLETAQKKQAISAFNPKPALKANPPPKGAAKPGAKYDAVDNNKYAAMVELGQRNPLAIDPKTGRQSAIPKEQVPALDAEKTALEVNRNKLADSDDSFQALAKLKNAGQVPASGAIPSVMAGLAGLAGAIGTGGIGGAIAGTLGNIAGHKVGDTVQSYFERNRAIQVEALKSRIGGNMSQEDKNKLADSFLPSWTDTPESMEEAHRKMVQHFESDPAESAPGLIRYGLKHPLPKYEFHYAKPKEKEVSKSKTKGASGGY